MLGLRVNIQAIFYKRCTTVLRYDVFYVAVLEHMMCSNLWDDVLYIAKQICELKLFSYF